MRILLIGKSGQLGGDLIRNNRGHEIVAPGRDHLDICSPAQVARALAESRPDVLVNTAAFHDLPSCEADPERAYLVNCHAVRELAAGCARAGVRFVTFSTDYVFAGDQRTPYHEDDPPAPLQLYGLSRAAGEQAALTAAPDHAVVIRTCGLYGSSGARSKGGNFVDKRILDARSCKVVEMGCDQVVSPTSTDDLSRAVLRLIGHPGVEPGIYHLTSAGACTWAEFTAEIYRLMGLDVEVRPVDRHGLSGDMRRPLYSVLANSKARSLGIELPPWQDALARYLATKYGTPA